MSSSLENLVFPAASVSSQTSSLSTIITDLKRTNFSIPNRLRSILLDARFVSDVAASFGPRGDATGAVESETGPETEAETEGGALLSSAILRPPRPLVANERCGSWYVPPESKGASAYFKSTDGHAGAWKFSTRRLNLHLLEVIGACDGCIIVDSTRRGKRMPDALSKTIPTWCTILNRALFPSLPPEKHDLFTPPQVVSPSEKAQIEALLPEFLASFLALRLDISSLASRVSKPLRPFWITPQDDFSRLDPSGEGVIFDEFHPVICCTASRRVQAGELTTLPTAQLKLTGPGGGQGERFTYVQGAADDTENWAGDLTPPVFWKHKDTLLSAPEADLPSLITSLVEESRLVPGLSGTDWPKVVAPGIAVCPSTELPNLHEGQGTFMSPRHCHISLLPNVTDKEEWEISPLELRVGLGKHKIASRNLRLALPTICNFAASYLEKCSSRNAPKDKEVETPPESQIVISCESGKDLAVAVALAINTWCFDTDGNFTDLKVGDSQRIFNKDMIRIRLGAIMTAFPEANPGRASLQSVNSFLMDYRR